MGFKEGWLPYRLTLRLVDNAVYGATRIQTQQQQQQQQSRKTAHQTEGVSQSDDDPETETASTSAEGDMQEVVASATSTEGDMQGAYSQLCSAILIFFMRKVLSVPESDAWDLLEHYLPDANDLDSGGATAVDLLEVDQYNLQGGTPDGKPAREDQCYGGDRPPAIAPEAPQEEASEQDEDGCVYEDMCPGVPEVPLGLTRPHPSSAPSQLSCSSTMGGEPRCGSGINWQDLRSRILSLGSHATYSVVSHTSDWSPTGDPMGTDGGSGCGNALEAVLGLLRVLGIHSRASDLTPLLHTYVNLLADRLCEAPECIASCLGQLWDALGVEQMATSSSSGLTRPLPSSSKRGGGGGAREASVIPAEASAAFSLVAQLAAHYCVRSATPRSDAGLTGGASSLGTDAVAAAGGMLPRQALWRQVHCGRLLELAAVRLVDLAVAPTQGPQQRAAALLIAQVCLCHGLGSAVVSLSGENRTTYHPSVKFQAPRLTHGNMP